jgi:plastocyanin
MRVRPLLIGVTTLAALVFAGQAVAANVTVWAGPGFLKAPPAGAPKTGDANLFFPKRVVIHVGDTVTFKSQGFHTATYLGTHKASEFQVFIPDQGGTYSGVTDAAGSPFYFNGLQKFA